LAGCEPFYQREFLIAETVFFFLKSMAAFGVLKVIAYAQIRYPLMSTMRFIFQAF
jgi:hypothetical protein